MSFNDRIKAMFDLIGMGQMIPNGSSGSSSRNGKTKQQQSQQTSKASNTSNVLVGRSNSRTRFNDNNHVSRNRSCMIRARKGISQENVFAPRLVHMMSLTNDSIPQWLSVEMMAKNRYHCAVYFIHCTEHRRVAMTRPSKQQALWMPFTPIPQNRSWREASLAGLLILLSCADMDVFLALKNALTTAAIKLFEVYDVQIPQTQETVTRLLWYVRLEPAALQSAHYRCCQQTESLQWINETDLDMQSSMLDPLWGFEPLNVYRMVVVNGANDFAHNKWPGASFEECSLETAFQYLPRKPPANNEEQLLVSTNMTEKDIERLYLDFLDHCFPCTSMTLHSFKVYMTKIRLAYADERMEHFFRAFNYHNNGHVTFPEFLMGLACIDNSSQHNETRAKFIVRYYDVHKRGYLTEDDIRIMIQDMLTMTASSSSSSTQSSTPVTPAVVEQKLAQVLAELDMEPDPSASVSADGSVNAPRRIINHRKLLIAIGTHKFRGTSRLCRLRGSILSAIMNANLRRSARNQARTNGNIGAGARSFTNYGHLLEKPYTGMCIGCKTKCAAVIDDRLVKLNADGFVVAQTKMAELAPPAPLAIKVSAGVSRKVRREKSQCNQGGSRGGGSASKNVPKRRTHRKHLKSKKHDIKVNNNNNNNNNNTSTSSESGGNLSSEDMSLQGSISSVSLDHQQSTISGGGGGSGNTPNEVVVALARALISNIRQFAPYKGTNQQPNGLFSGSQSDRQIFLDHMEMIERHVTPMLRATRCAPVTSPAFVIGDIHGNLADLLSLEAALWKRAPVIGPNLIFLGDMVDRGKWSVECVTYLLCLKVIMPQKVTLLRGNHEVRKLQCHYTYRKECFAKYGYDEGGRMWELTNRIFDSLPLCAVIDEQIYCAHGGIPRATINLRDVSALPEVIEDPEQSCPIAWEILWSDPLHQQLFVEMARFTGIDPMSCQGYLPNQKRGTAWAFNEEALDRFLSVNGLSHVVRAHEVQNNGFFFHFRKKCATIFSCSHYCGNNNESAVLLVDRDVIRVVRIDTTNNQSATD